MIVTVTVNRKAVEGDEFPTPFGTKIVTKLEAEQAFYSMEFRAQCVVNANIDAQKLADNVANFAASATATPVVTTK